MLVFEKSLLCTLTLDEYLDLYLTRVDGLRRRISCAVEREHGLEYSLIRETFQMSRLITHRRSVTNAPSALSPSTAPAVSAALIGEPTPFTEATATTSQATSLVSVQFLSARRPHRKTQDDKMNMILQALAMSGLQIQMPSPDLVPPSTSQPFHPTDT
ncbi:unnamed protein product [Malus baccata var. baccata]